MTQDVDVPVAVLDTSVLIPSWSRKMLQRLAALESPPYRPVWSDWIIAETWRVLTWRWCRRATHSSSEWTALSDSANRMLRQLAPVMTLVSFHSGSAANPWSGLRDEDDTPIWQTAVASKAQYVVSHNTADFPPRIHGRHRHAGVEYLTAAEFIEDILGEDLVILNGRPLPAGGNIRSRRTH